MITPASIETGILKTFRLFTRVRLGLFIFSILVYYLTAGWDTWNSFLFLIFILLDVGLLLVYLSLPRLEKILKKVYLPVGIAWSTLGPLLELHLVFYMLSTDILDKFIFLLALQLILVLFIPLVIIGWRYAMRAVILFSVLTFLADNVLFFFLYWLSNKMAFTLPILPILGMSFIRTILFLLVGNMIANLVKVQREQNEQLAKAYKKLAEYSATQEKLAISRERNRMARELHDVMAHTMSGVAVELEGVRSMLRIDPDRAEKLLSDSLSAVREGLTETRRALQALRASPIEDMGLGLAIRNLTESIAGRTGIQIEQQIENDMPDYPVEVQQCLYRVVQEALVNVISHSQASKVEVCLKNEGTLLKLSIRDNGIGFDQNTVEIDQKYGLLGMRERVEMINGNLSIISKVGSGTQILLTYESTSMEVSNERY